MLRVFRIALILALITPVAKAATGQPGTPYSAIPVVTAGKPVVVVLFAMPDGRTSSVNVELR